MNTVPVTFCCKNKCGQTPLQDAAILEVEDADVDTFIKNINTDPPNDLVCPKCNGPVSLQITSN